MSESQTKICPYCAEEIKLEAILCKHCHSRLAEPESAPTRSAEPSKAAAPAKEQSSTSAPKVLSPLEVPPAKRRQTSPIAPLVAIIILFAGVVGLLGTQHIVTGKSGTYLIPKDGFSFSNTLVNLNSWGPLDLVAHPRLAAKIVAAGHGMDLPGAGVVAAVGEAIKGGAEALQNVGTTAELKLREVSDAAKRLLSSQAYKGARNSANSAADPRVGARKIAAVIEAYAVDHGAYPIANSLTELRQLVVPTYASSLPGDGSRGDYVVVSTSKGYRVVLASGEIVVSVGDVEGTTRHPGSKVDSASARSTVVIPASRFDNSFGVEVGVLPYGDDVIHNGPPYGPRENWVEFNLTGASGHYELWIEYAAEVARPVQVFLNGTFQFEALRETTGGWHLANQQSKYQGVLSLPDGSNRLRIYRGDVFPHMRTIELRPVS